ncbi:hypothetical protein O181_095748 [Austropuccinia psidii MF-1]|uniref:Hydrophobin n=1 Tax=Austropuccinia psidii MF-1 TaxID=1389203 RepID=A0A9Q3J5N7_9BASI|nr:hypothetical protein [Austropuccinia psidii MF-1]
MKSSPVLQIGVFLMVALLQPVMSDSFRCKGKKKYGGCVTFDYASDNPEIQYIDVPTVKGGGNFECSSPEDACCETEIKIKQRYDQFKLGCSTN